MINSARESDSGPDRNLANGIVIRLCLVYFGTGRDIYVDRYFTSHGLVCNLLQQNLTLIGTIMANAGMKYHRSSKQLREKRSIAQRHCMTILTKFFYCHTSPNATRMCSWCPLYTLPFPSRTATKNTVITDYNLKHKGGADCLDENC